MQQVHSRAPTVEFASLGRILHSHVVDGSRLEWQRLQTLQAFRTDPTPPGPAVDWPGPGRFARHGCHFALARPLASPTRRRCAAWGSRPRPNTSMDAHRAFPPDEPYLSAFDLFAGGSGSRGVAPGVGSNRFTPLPSMFVQNVPLPAWNNRSTSFSLNFWASE